MEQRKENQPPSTTVGNGEPGRDATTGRFTTSNKFAKGNPHARRVAALRSEFLRVMTPKRFRAAIAALFREAMTGDVAALREMFDRTIGRVPFAEQAGGAEEEGPSVIRTPLRIDLNLIADQPSEQRECEDE